MQYKPKISILEKGPERNCPKSSTERQKDGKYRKELRHREDGVRSFYMYIMWWKEIIGKCDGSHFTDMIAHSFFRTDESYTCSPLKHIFKHIVEKQHKV